MTLGLTALTLASWGSVIAVDAANLPEHLYHDVLQVATVASNALLLTLGIGAIIGHLHQVNERLDRAYRAMARISREQPDLTLTPQPWPRLHSVGDGDEPALRNGHGGSPR